MEHPIFSRFEAVTSETTGEHMFDFLGVRTKVAYKSGWAKHAQPAGKTARPGLPPHNEHYFDWIATLTAVDRASDTLRMVELGAGWAPWLVRAAHAAEQRPGITNIELLGMEADPSHYSWMVDHFVDNGIDPVKHHLLNGAAAGQSGTLEFPEIASPDVDYGASLAAAKGNIPTIEVRAFSLAEIFGHLSGKIDFMHVDIQGAEYDIFPEGMSLIAESVRMIMIGTHQSNEKHENLASLFKENGWVEVMNFERNAVASTDFGDVQFGDGFLLFENPRL